MKTATQVDAAPTVSVVASPKVIAAIKEQLNVELQLDGKVEATRKAIVDEASLHGYNREQAYTMTKLSWRKAQGLAATASEAEIIDFDKRHGPEVSKIMTLAFPKKENAAELAKVLEHNSKNPGKNTRVGLIRLARVARGDLTAHEAINRIAPPRAPRNKGANGSKTGTPAERFADAIAGLRQQFLKEKMELSEMRKIAAAGFADAVATK